MSKKTVCVIFGGKSSEYEISLISAANVLNNIDKEKYNIVTVGITKDGRWYLYNGDYENIRNGKWTYADNKLCIFSPDTYHRGLLVINKNGEVSVTHIDVVFPVLHGKNGEDGAIQGIFEMAGVPYVGCGVLASSLCMDKVLAKEVFKSAGIPVTDGFNVDDYEASQLDDINKKIKSTIDYPVVVKPSNAGSSVGVSLVKNETELAAALTLAAENDRRILIEMLIDAREVECAVLGGYGKKVIASVPGELVNDNEMYDYDTKYVNGTTSVLIPANLSADDTKKLQDYAIRAFNAVNGFGLSRVDFFVRKSTGEILLNEINTIPGFTSISMYPMLFDASGIPYGKLLTKLIELAEER